MSRAVVRTLVALSVALASPAGAISIKKEAERKRAPAFELKDGEGRVVRLSDYRGRVVLLDFWATWCGPCQSQIPWLIEISRKYEAQGLTVIAFRWIGTAGRWSSLSWTGWASRTRS